MKIKRLVLAGCVIAILGTCSGCSLLSNNPYNSKNIVFFRQDLDDYSSEMSNFLDKNFHHFESIMRNMQDGNYDRCVYSDIEAIDKYMDIILSCNFRGYDGVMWRYRDREQSGFVIDFENYFPINSEERNLVEKFSGYFENIIRGGYRSVNPDVEQIVADCTTDYHAYRDQIYQLPVFPRYIILKIVRPIIASNDSQYLTPNCSYYRDKTLAEIDAEISRCRWIMEKQCANPDVNYNVSRR